MLLRPSDEAFGVRIKSIMPTANQKPIIPNGSNEKLVMIHPPLKVIIKKVLKALLLRPDHHKFDFYGMRWVLFPTPRRIR